MVAWDDDSWNALQASFLGELYESYCRDARSVGTDWQQLFSSLSAEGIVTQKQQKNQGTKPKTLEKGVGQSVAFSASDVSMRRVLDYIHAVRARGHYLADLDPLRMRKRHQLIDLEPSFYGIDPSDDQNMLYVGDFYPQQLMTAKALVERTQRLYGSTVALDYAHIDEQEQRLWLQKRMEEEGGEPFSRQEKMLILEKLSEGEMFEHFLQRHYPGAKRFSLEGAESLLPCLEFILRTAVGHGVEAIELGMAHRGRLNVLAHILQKPLEALFYQFNVDSSSSAKKDVFSDVKYHMGASTDRNFDGRHVHLSLASNPSHLEMINTVVLGKVRAKQNAYRRDTDGGINRRKVLGILVHGDAAFSGQGVVTEALDLSDLAGYRTGGTLHVIVNNQIGFTTNVNDARSSAYCSDHAKAIQAPIFHVNGDDPLQVVRVIKMAVDFRMAFCKDVFVDLYCYRRHGHSEVDDPSFTQPLMYQRIAQLPSTRSIFSERLQEEGCLTAEDDKALCAGVNERLRAAASSDQARKPPPSDWLGGRWRGRGRSATAPQQLCDSVVLLESSSLQKLAQLLFSYPEGFAIHPKLKALYAKRLLSVKQGRAIDWPTAELLAFASLLYQSVPIRMSGQDSQRGTFSQRHALVVSQKDAAKYMPLQAMNRHVDCEIINSPLSEAGVLGFEYGFSLVEPKALVVWEAQFGDFANGAQVMIDQFITAAESKWLRMSGLVMLLPHGYEGQGPDHSSARLERYLQLCAQGNMTVANCTTPANYYHLLHRQVMRPFRKPLVVMTPKSLLRHPQCVSPLADFCLSEGFQRVLADPEAAQLGSVRRILCCSGRVYYDLIAERAKRKIRDVMILRVEQLYPFPALDLEGILRNYPQALIVWCQEEPENMGAWVFVSERLRRLASVQRREHKRPGLSIFCVARPRSAVTATGLPIRHKLEHETLLNKAFADDAVFLQQGQGGNKTIHDEHNTKRLEVM